MMPKKLDRQSLEGSELNLEALYAIAPSCFTEVEDEQTGEIKRVVNFDTLRSLLGDHSVEEGYEMYQFTWPGKKKARMKAVQATDQTLLPVLPGSVGWDKTENVYIEGDNLSVLKLLQKSYLGKIKMIYIDPPYNTGSDFVYNDKFSHSAKDQRIASGSVDAAGNYYLKNTDGNGRFHSDWCSMIFSRLLAAHPLLAEDGVIFISIDENEVHNLRKISDEVFGEKNFVADFIRKTKSTTNDAKTGINYQHEFLLCYAKNIQKMNRFKGGIKDTSHYRNPDNDPNGEWIPADPSAKNGTLANGYFPVENPYTGKVDFPPQGMFWRFSKNTIQKHIAEGKICFKKEHKPDERGFIYKRYLRDLGTLDRTFDSLVFTDNKYMNQNATKLLKEMGLVEYFPYPKGLNFIAEIISSCTSSDDIILDFFSGSATTAHAVMQLNAEDLKEGKDGKRKYICVQLEEQTGEKTAAHLAGYATIPDIAKERIRRAGEKIQKENPEFIGKLDIGFRTFRLDDSNYEKGINKEPKDYSQELLGDLINNIKDDRSDLDLLFGAMLSWGVPYSLSQPMKTEEIDGCAIYNVADGKLVACFSERITAEVVRTMAKMHPERILFRDSCFAVDKDKINIFEQLKQQLDWGDKEALDNIRVI